MTVRPGAVLAGLAGIVALAAVPALAQPVPPPKVATPQVPPGWLLVPTVGVAQIWDDNITLAGSDADAIDDYVTAVSPSLGLHYRGKRTTFGADYYGTYDFYRELRDFNNAAHRGRVDLSQRLSRHLSVFARDNFTISPTTEDTPVPGLVLRRRTSRFNDFRGGLDIALSSRTTISTAYTSQWIDFAGDNLVAPLLRGGYSHGGEASIKRRMNERLTLGASYDYQHAMVSRGREAFDIQDAGLLAELLVTPSLSLSAQGGYAWLSPGREEGRRNAPTFRVGLGWQLRRGALDIAYGRSFMPSFGFGGTIQNEELVGSFSLPIARRVMWTGGVGVRENDPLTSVETSLRSVIAQSSFIFLATRWMKVEVFGTHAFQDSRLAGGQIARTRVGIQIATSQSLRMR